MTLSRPQLLKLARAGAEARLAELQAEISAIRRSFPELGRGKPAAKSAGASRTGRRGWSPAQRKAAADRMKKYWAAKKTGKK